MKNRFRISYVLVLAALATSAFAGYKNTVNVGVDPVSRRAYGYLGTAHNSADTVQYIGCSTSAGATGTYATCEARGIGTVTGSCYTDNPHMLDAVRMIQHDSFLLFSWDTNYVCTQVITLNYSWSEPKR